MLLVRQLIQTKPGDIWSVPPTATVYETLQLMADKDIGAVLVVDEGRLVGIFSERDYARKVFLKGKSLEDTPVGMLMTHTVFYVTPDQSIEECMALMTEKHIRHLPVIENERLVGIVTIGDLVKAVISEQQVLIRSLEHYITGSDYNR